MKRFFVQAPEDIQVRLQHLALDLKTSAEKLAGEMLAEFVAHVEAEVKSGKRKPKEKK